MDVHQALEYLDNLEVSSDGYSSDESSGDDFVSTATLVLVPPKDNHRETDEDSANEDDPKPSCLNKDQLLAETEVNLNTSKAYITLNDRSFSHSSIEKNSSNSQPSSTKRKQPLKVSSQNSCFSFLLSLWEIQYSFLKKKKTSGIFSLSQCKCLYSAYLLKKKH